MTDLEFLTAKEVCGLLKINPATLWRWVKAGTFPRAAGDRAKL